MGHCFSCEGCVVGRPLLLLLPLRTHCGKKTKRTEGVDEEVEKGGGREGGRAGSASRGYPTVIAIASLSLREEAEGEGKGKDLFPPPRR